MVLQLPPHVLFCSLSTIIETNITFCLNLYTNLSGQKPNLSKSAIYLPSWFNKRVSKSIASILGINIGNFPFTYLGVLSLPSVFLLLTLTL